MSSALHAERTASRDPIVGINDKINKIHSLTRDTTPKGWVSRVGGGDAPRERAMFWLFDAVGGLLDGEKRLLERGDPVGDRLVCDACRVWSPLVRDLSEGGDEFAYFREAYRLFRS